MKVLVVDDHALIRNAMRGVLRQLRQQIEVLEAPDLAAAEASVNANPDIQLIVLDLGLPGQQGFDALARLRGRFPAVAVAVLSGTHDPEIVAKSLDLGAVGFIPKATGQEVMLSAFSLILSGGIYIPPEILALREVPASGAQPDANGSGGLVTPADCGLTARQMEVLALMMGGMSNKAICRTLDLAEPTVKNHVSSILKALNAGNRTEAVARVGALGWKLPQPRR